ncbi:DUF971 domain-containing protein [Seohaeicola saemankumensis]|nr:DUF971 domain-containing protein [Seohaeicola saemankumensis]MCA0869441.1 DUF971 domain-containing protein [Seohaeicola saemankumensis]
MIHSLCATEDARRLTVNWDSGDQSQLSAETLRREARDAWTTRQRIDFGEVSVSPGLTITGIYQIGRGGVNVHFSDGHDRAIYPFEYLRELSDRFDK